MEIILKPTLKQHIAYQALDKYDDFFFGGGAGGGKSWFICESRLVRAIRYPGYKSFIGRNELKRLMQSTFLTWVKVCQFHGLQQGVHWRLDGKYNVIELFNGSKIDLLDLAFKPSEDPLYERFGSLEYSDGAIEEAGEVHPLAREVLKTRRGRQLNDVYGINPCLLNTGNPKKNWTYQVFYKPWKNKTLPANMFFLQSLFHDNPHTAKQYGEILDGIKDPITRARLRDGNWEYENDPSALMDYEAITDLFTNVLDISDELGYEGDNIAQKKYATLDVARFGGDKIVLGLWEGWTLYKVLWREKQSLETTRLWVKETLQTERIPFSHTMADEDGVGGGIVDGLPGIKGFIANSSPVEEDMPAEVDYSDWEEQKRNPKMSYANLKTQCAYKLAEKVNKRECAVHTEDVQIQQWITEELEQIKEKNADADDKKKHIVSKEDVKAAIGRSPDFGDMMVMRAVFELREPKKAGVIHQYRPKFISRKR